MIYLAEKKIAWDYHTFLVEAGSKSEAVTKAIHKWPRFKFLESDFHAVGDCYDYVESTFPDN